MKLKKIGPQPPFLKKQLNIHLYIPPHSDHPPGVINRIIYGQIYHITTLCSEEEDQKSLIRQFFRRPIKRGHNRQNVLPFFEKSIVHYKKKSLTPEPPPPQQLDHQSKTQQLFFHVRYHPDNVKSFEYQCKFKGNTLKSQYRHHLSNIKNKSGNELKLDRMVVLYSRPPNLTNILSYRKIKAHICPPT